MKKNLIRSVLSVTVMLVVFSTGKTAVTARQSLTGPEALRFLQETGLYRQIAAETGGLSPVGREFFPTGQIDAYNGSTDDLFGISVARDGDTVLIGAPQADIDGVLDQGAAYVFTDSSLGWILVARLVAADGAAGDGLGFSVALEGNRALIGAPQADIDGDNDQGAAYVFTRAGVFWSQSQKLLVQSGSAGDAFGSAVALDGPTALIGAPQDDIAGDVDQGAAYVFTYTSGVWNQQAQLTSADTHAGDQFGSAVALDAGSALIGAPFEDIGFDADQGAAYIFTGAGSSWSQQARLVADDGAAGDQLGGAVALSADTALLGAHLADVDGVSNTGAGYLFTRTAGAWSLAQKLAAADGAQGDRLGRSVALEGDTALLGAPMANIGGNNNQGAAYVFIHTDGSWSQQSKLSAWTAGEAGDRFGRAVALDGDTALVGAIYGEPPYSNPDRGLVYLFARGQVSWLPHGEAIAADGEVSDRFGFSVAFDGGTALVGAIWADINGNAAQGAAYIFERSPNIWVQVAKLTAADGAATDEFGIAVALEGDTALVGASAADILGMDNQGAAYVFTRNGNTWTQQAKLTASDGIENDFFGRSVALDGDTAVVGAYGAEILSRDGQGAAYVFTRTGDSWTQQTKLTASDGDEGDLFGGAVALSGGTALVGAYHARTNSIEHGAAYVFTLSGGSWSQQAKLTAGDSAAGDNFGWKVALDGNTALIGAPGELSLVGEPGAAYIFIRAGGSWSQQARLEAADGGDGSLGYAVALDGDTALIGARWADIGGKQDQGAAYIFVASGGSWSQQARLTANDGNALDYFGSAVALDGDIGLVGAIFGGDSGQGKAYFFQRQPYELFLPILMR